jgi:hypothetical protein
MGLASVQNAPSISTARDLFEVAWLQSAGTSMSSSHIQEGIVPAGVDVAAVDNKEYATQLYEVEKGIHTVAVWSAAMTRTVIVDGLVHAFGLMFDNTR